MSEANLVVRGIGTLATLAGSVPRRGRDLRDLGLVLKAAVASRAGRILWVGEERELGRAVAVSATAQVIDAAGGLVIPGLVDSHTHLAFAGDRDDEITRRLAGESYAEIAATGGGIRRTVASTRKATVDDLARAVLGHLDLMLLSGTTTAEVKSGYGLELEAEVRSLEAIRRAAARHPMTIVPTFLGAHEVPPEYERQRYVAHLVEEMIPAIASRGLARFGDVFCEEGVFSVAESRRILEAYWAHGLGLRIHADELTWTGGAELGAELGARSADHLVHVSDAGIAALAQSGCVATLLPSAAFYLRLGRFAPARAMIEAGVAVALASDVNPGGGLSPSLPFAMTLATFGMGLSLEEAILATTVNAAASLDLGDEVGQIAPGFRTDLLILRQDRILDLVRIGVPAIQTVVKNGRVVVSDGRLVWSDASRKSGSEGRP